MAEIQALKPNGDDFECWFENYHYVYESELAAIKTLMPKKGMGVEIGMGTGRYAGPLGIDFAVDPARAILEKAGEKAIQMMKVVPEVGYLPAGYFDFALCVTTTCYVDPLTKALEEAWRILKPGGAAIIGFIDKNSSMGKAYQEKTRRSRLYRDANFHYVDEVVMSLRKGGFDFFSFVQTIIKKDFAQITNIEPVKTGYGKGSFVVVRAIKQTD